MHCLFDRILLLIPNVLIQILIWTELSVRKIQLNFKRKEDYIFERCVFHLLYFYVFSNTIDSPFTVSVCVVQRCVIRHRYSFHATLYYMSQVDHIFISECIFVHHTTYITISYPFKSECSSRKGIGKAV